MAKNNNYNEVFRAILKEEGLTQEQAAKIMGLGNQGALSKKLVYGITINAILLLTDKLGYRIVLEKVMPNGKVRERYELTRGEE